MGATDAAHMNGCSTVGLTFNGNRNAEVQFAKEVAKSWFFLNLGDLFRVVLWQHRRLVQGHDAMRSESATSSHIAASVPSIPNDGHKFSWSTCVVTATLWMSHYANGLVWRNDIPMDSIDARFLKAEWSRQHRISRHAEKSICNYWHNVPFSEQRKEKARGLGSTIRHTLIFLVVGLCLRGAK